jgi:hypothetical protein
MRALLQELAPPDKPTKWTNWAQQLAKEEVGTENDLLELAEKDFDGLPVSATFKSVLRKFRSSRSNTGAGEGQPPPPPSASPSPSLSTELHAGSRVGRYTIVRLIQTSEKSRIFLASEEDEEYIPKQVLDPSAFICAWSCVSKTRKEQRPDMHVRREVFALV